MFKAAEIGRSISKEEFDARIPALRTELINTQFDLRDATFPVVILLAGEDRLGCHELLGFLTQVLDSRFLHVSAFGRPGPEEAERPPFWRYWNTLPPTGRIGVLIGAWTVSAIIDRLEKKTRKSEFVGALHHCREFEATLADEGALILKFWLHVPRSALKKQVEGSGKKKWWQPPVRASWRINKDYDRGMDLVEQAIQETNTEHAAWNVIESTDHRYRDLTTAETILREIRRRLDEGPRRAPAKPEAVPAEDPHTILDTVDLGASLSKEDYEPKLIDEQKKLNQLSNKAFKDGVSTVMVFEGWDAAGKGGCIRRVTAAMDATISRVIPIAAPTEEERAHHYLWRFWRHLPRAGRVVIFDRSWYGRVLVERVEGFANHEEWTRAYSEICEFESQLVEHGVVLLKFWLHVDRETQLQRFKERESTPFKQFKITEEDYRNREKWNAYEAAVNEMVARTSTRRTPWSIVPSNNKYFARIEILKTINKALSHRIK